MPASNSQSAEALDRLTREGPSESEAVGAALVEAARRRGRRSELAREIRRIARDPEDEAERRAMMADMEVLSRAWPE